MKAINAVKTFTDAHAPSILTVTGVVGVAATAALASRATLRSRDLINHVQVRDDKDLSPFEVVKVTWKLWIPTITVAATTIGSICYGNHIALKRGASLLQAYNLLDSAFSEYKEEVVKRIGEKKNDEIEGVLAQKRVDETSPSEDVMVVLPRGEKPLVLDELSGRYFRMDPEEIRQAVNTLNASLIAEDWVSLNTFYGLIGLPPIGLGDTIGWTANRLLEIRFSSALTKDNDPCVVIKYDTRPKVDYYEGY